MLRLKQGRVLRSSGTVTHGRWMPALLKTPSTKASFTTATSVSASSTALDMTLPQRDGKDRLIIFDTTLRDGEQSPGATLTMDEKLKIARLLSALGVDVCEAGFPIASPGDFDAVSAIAEEIGNLTENRLNGKPMAICGLSRAHEKDILRCHEAVKHVAHPRIHTFLATSDVHLKYKLKIDREECIKRAASAVEYAASLCEDIEFSPEDAGRSDPDFLCDVLGEVIKAGATTLNIPDTVGYTVPEEYENLIAYLKANTPGAENVVFSTHCHNDLGLATANTLAGVKGGARQVEVTMNGIGERAGNTSLEEIVMTLATRPQKYDIYSSIDATHITRTSRMVSAFTGMSVQPNKAIVGANAFAHEAGIHQDGVLKHAETYEIMTPESVGLNTNALVLGKHSGKHAYRKRLEQLGYTDLSEEEVENLVNKFKTLADEKKTVTDADMEAIINDVVYQPDIFYQITSVHVTAGDRVKPTATVTLLDKDGNEMSAASMGTGPVDAIYTAIDNVTKIPCKLTEYQVSSVTDGIEAQGSVTAKIAKSDYESDGEDPLSDPQDSVVNPQSGLISQREYTGHGASTDILVASARAYVAALNRLMSAETPRRRKNMTPP